MYFPLEKLMDYDGNRFELAKACIEYAKKVRMLKTDEFIRSGEKDALVALRVILEGEIKFTTDEFQLEDYDEDLANFLEPLDNKDQF